VLVKKYAADETSSVSVVTMIHIGAVERVAVGSAPFGTGTGFIFVASSLMVWQR
jgi:hypothetical protein